VVPYFGTKPIGSIEAPDLLEVLKRIEAKSIIDTAHRTREVCGRICIGDLYALAQQQLAQLRQPKSLRE
jgi:integrase-like protein